MDKKLNILHLELFLVLLIFPLFTMGCRKESIQLYGENLQTEIILPEGQRIFIDVIGEDFPSSPFTTEDIMAVTFSGPDHYNPDLIESFPGKTMLFTKDSCEQEGINLKMIPSARNEGDKITDTNATNYLLLISTDDCNILYCGDIGQDHFTPEQLDIIGDIDICFMPLENRYCNMTMKNKKGFTLIKELNPRIVIPLRYKDSSLEYTVENFTVYTSLQTPASIPIDKIPEKTSFLIIDRMAAVYHDIYKTRIWKN